jgi:hypothetical protein
MIPGLGKSGILRISFLISSTVIVDSIAPGADGVGCGGQRY